MTAHDVRPRVLHVVTSYPPDFSGHGRQLMSLIPYLARLGIESSVLTSRVAASGIEETLDGTLVSRLPRTPLELIEQVDMLRTLEHGYPVRLVFTETRLLGVDVPGDIAKGEALLAADAVTPRYLAVPR